MPWNLLKRFGGNLKYQRATCTKMDFQQIHAISPNGTEIWWIGQQIINLGHSVNSINFIDILANSVIQGKLQRNLTKTNKTHKSRYSEMARKINYSEYSWNTGNSGLYQLNTIINHEFNRPALWNCACLSTFWTFKI